MPTGAHSGATDSGSPVAYKGGVRRSSTVGVRGARWAMLWLWGLTMWAVQCRGGDIRWRWWSCGGRWQRWEVPAVGWEGEEWLGSINLELGCTGRWLIEKLTRQPRPTIQWALVLRVGQTVSTEDEDAVSVVVHGQVVTRGEKLRKGRQWLLYRRREGEGWDGGGMSGVLWREMGGGGVCAWSGFGGGGGRGGRCVGGAIGEWKRGRGRRRRLIGGLAREGVGPRWRRSDE
jgi:hypothetical protein